MKYRQYKQVINYYLFQKLKVGLSMAHPLMCKNKDMQMSLAYIPKHIKIGL